MLLYIHIPFCDSKCSYCSFNSYVDRFETRPEYMDALLRQWEYERDRFAADPGTIETVFIGGGTPSTVSPALYEALFSRIESSLAPGAEISCEANPNSATREWLRGMRALGVNRISFGVQSFDDAKLRVLRRAHTSAQALRAVEEAASAGFERISLDLIYNCAGDDRTLLENDIRQAVSLPITHLSAYELTIEEGTLFARRPDARREDEALARFVAETIAQQGLPQYEISNFGDPCRHNLGYWRRENYIGLGAGAVGFLDERRFYPPASIDAYLADPLTHRSEPIDDEARRTETLFLGLRSCVGVGEETLTPAIRRRADLLIGEGKLFRRDGRLYNPDFFLADEVALYLLD